MGHKRQHGHARLWLLVRLFMFRLVLALLTRKAGFPRSSHRRFRERGTVDGSVGTAMPSPDRGPATCHAQQGNRDFRTRKRGARRAKRVLAGSNHRQFAAASQGKAPDGTLRRDKKKKKRRNIKATVCHIFRDQKVNLNACE